MKKNERLKIETWLRKTIDEYVEVLNLQAHQLQDLRYLDEEDDALFRVYCNYPYKNYSVGYTPEAVKMFNKKNLNILRHGVMHELYHVVLAELVAKAQSKSTTREIEDSMESTVDHLANVMMKYV